MGNNLGQRDDRCSGGGGVSGLGLIVMGNNLGQRDQFRCSEGDGSTVNCHG